MALSDGVTRLVLVIPAASPAPRPLQPFRETPEAMTDYERSTRATYRDYKPPKKRTSDWVSRLPPKHAAQSQFLDPTMPPSDTDSAVYSSDSDAESSHSVPPPLILRFPDGRQEHVSGGYYSSPNASLRNTRSRAASGPVNNYGPRPSHHHSRSLSLHPTSGHPQAHPRGPLLRPHTSNTNTRPQEEIRVLPPQRSMTPGTAGYVNSRSQRSSTQPHHPRSSSVVAPTPRRAYTSGDATHQGPPDNWAKKYGPPQSIAYSHSHPPSKYDPPTRDYSAKSYRPHPSSRLSRQSVTGSPISQMSLLTKENTIANSHSRALSRGVIADDWSVIDEDEEWEKEQQRTAYRRGRTSSQSSASPTLTHSRSRTTSSSSRSDYYGPGSKVRLPVSIVFLHR